MILESLSLKWLSPKYFFEGWNFFLQEEIINIPAWCIIVVAANLISFVDCRIPLSVQLLLVILMRRILAGGICTSSKRLDGQTIVITGANSGIGYETSRDLAKRGAKIIMACRDTKKAEKLAAVIIEESESEVEVMTLDLSSLASVRSFADDLKAKYSKIHCLVNNAGVMMCPYQKTEDGFEFQMGVNHFGHFLLTILLLPLLNHDEPARILSVTSCAHTIGKIPFDDINYDKGYGPFKAYANSKLANILFIRHLAKILQETNISVFAIHPGAVQSDLGRHLPFGAGYFYRYALQLFSKTVAEGTQTSIYCATEATQHPSHYFSDCGVGCSSRGAQDDDAAEQLWKLSLKLVGIDKFINPVQSVK